MPARRTSNKEKQAAGTSRKDRTRSEMQLPAPVEYVPVCPLTGPEAESVWASITENLAKVRVLASDDLIALTHLCNLHQHCCDRWAERNPPTAADLTQLRVYLTEFGLTPASRSKATPQGQEVSDNPFLQLVK